jgi:hypothetical protein
MSGKPSDKYLAIDTQSMKGLEEPFLDSGKKFLQPTRSGCICNVA